MPTSKKLTIYNPQRGQWLVQNGAVADSFWSRFKGLIGRKTLAEGYGLLIDPCNSIHCFFMSMPIDVLYLDAQNKVVGIDVNLRPWRIGGFYKGAKRVVELPVGTVAASGTAGGGSGGGEAKWVDAAIGYRVFREWTTSTLFKASASGPFPEWSPPN